MKFKKGDEVWILTFWHGIASGKVNMIMGTTYYIRIEGELYYKLPKDVFGTEQQAIDYFGGRE